jgi:hypothetical protein
LQSGLWPLLNFLMSFPLLLAQPPGEIMLNIQFVRTWIPAIFSAFIVYTYMGHIARGLDPLQSMLFGLGAVQAVSIWSSMCFFFVSAVAYSMQKQIGKLEAEVRELRGAMPATPATP